MIISKQLHFPVHNKYSIQASCFLIKYEAIIIIITHQSSIILNPDWLGDFKWC